MPLEPDQMLSHYRLVEKIGEGGMGVVWKAEDMTLDRDVAIKILPEDVAEDAVRLARFEREAKLLASLNHPNIATIHGFEKVDGIHFLVMELVPGQTLVEMLQPGSLPIEEALNLGRQVAEGLEAAHAAGVIHRDLKPGNVKVTPEGQAKVLDFGLAKGLTAETASGSEADLSLSPTVTGGGTEAGVVLGTAPYMSPEQARGKPLDKRTDIWSFGCLLFECLTGRMVFAGETVTDILSAILQTEPAWSSLPERTPLRVRELLERCLEKNPKKRLRDIGDAELEIEKALAGREWTTSGTSAGTALPTGRHRSWAATAGAAAALLAVGSLIGVVGGLGLGRSGSPPIRPGRVVRFSISPPQGLEIIPKWDLTLRPDVMLSPDGEFIVYAARVDTDSESITRAYMRRLDRLDTALFLGQLRNWDRITFSADGRWAAVIEPVSPGSSRRRLVKIPTDGSAPPVEVASLPTNMGLGLVWLPGGEIVVSSLGKPWSLMQLPADGSEPATPVKIRAFGLGDYMIVPLGPLPDGRHVLAMAQSYSTRGWQYNVLLLDTRTGDTRLLIEDATVAHWLSTGHLLFTRGDTLHALPFDLERLEATGPPVAILSGIRPGQIGLGGWFHVSASGTLVYFPGGNIGADRRLAVLDRDGIVNAWSDDRREFQNIAVSQDGRRMAAAVYDPAERRSQIWISDVDRPHLQPFVHGPGEDCGIPIFSPSAVLLAYYCWRTGDGPGVYIRQADGTAPGKKLLAQESAELTLEPSSFSPDGSTLLVTRWLGGSRYEVLLLPMDDSGPEADRTPMAFLTDHSNPRWGRFSPDGRWIAYMSDDTGRFEVYLREYRSDGATGPPRLISSGGGNLPLWFGYSSGETQELFYDGGKGQMVAVTIAVELGLTVSDPRPILNAKALRLYGKAGVLPLPDGRWLAIQEGEEESSPTRIDVVLNFQEEIKRKFAEPE